MDFVEVCSVYWSIFEKVNALLFWRVDHLFLWPSFLLKTNHQDKYSTAKNYSNSICSCFWPDTNSFFYCYWIDAPVAAACLAADVKWMAEKLGTWNYLIRS